MFRFEMFSDHCMLLHKQMLFMIYNLLKFFLAAGNVVMTFDVVINPKFFEKIKSREILRCFLVQVIFQGLENKFKINIKEEGGILFQDFFYYTILSLN